MCKNKIKKKKKKDVLGTKFDEIPQNIMLSVGVCQRTSKIVYIMKFYGELA